MLDPVTAPVPPTLAPGQVLLGRYTLIVLLGDGMGGQTWRARPADGGPDVAIKVVPAGSTPERGVALVREATFLRELAHPHVVRYLGVIDLPELAATFLLTELAEGGSLDDLVFRTGPRAPRAAAKLLLQLVDALAAVHAGGVLHRDLKPHNVLVRDGADGEPHLMLADFGISRRTVQGSSAVTMPVGSVGYGAPEVWTRASVTHAADVWSLGAIGWFLLSGVHPEPIPGTWVPDPARLAALAPPGCAADRRVFVELLRDMMRDAPEARPSLASVRAGLLTVLEAPEGRGDTQPTLPLANRTLSPEEPVPVPSRRPPILAGLFVLGALVFVAALTGWAIGRVPERAETPVVGAVEPEAAERAPEADVRPPTSAPSSPAVAAVEPGPVARASEPPRSEPRRSADSPLEVHERVPAADAAVRPERVIEADGGEPLNDLRVGLVLPNGLPEEASLRVRGPGVDQSVSNTQLLVPTGRAGRYTVEVRTPTRVLGSASVDVPAGDRVRVTCDAAGGDLRALTCTVRP